MCSKRKFLIIVTLCVGDILPTCTCFENTKPPPKPKPTAQKPPAPAPTKKGDAVPPPPVAATETIPSLTALIQTASVAPEAAYIPISNAFIWPPPSEWTNPMADPNFNAEEDLIASATRAHLSAKPQANRRQTIIDGTKWALCTVAVLFVGTFIYKLFTLPDRILEEWRKELRERRDKEI